MESYLNALASICLAGHTEIWPSLDEAANKMAKTDFQDWTGVWEKPWDGFVEIASSRFESLSAATRLVRWPSDADEVVFHFFHRDAYFYLCK